MDSTLKVFTPWTPLVKTDSPSDTSTTYLKIDVGLDRVGLSSGLYKSPVLTVERQAHDLTGIISNYLSCFASLWSLYSLIIIIEAITKVTVATAVKECGIHQTSLCSCSMSPIHNKNSSKTIPSPIP
jgi:hypothetical protein